MCHASLADMCTVIGLPFLHEVMTLGVGASRSRRSKPFDDPAVYVPEVSNRESILTGPLPE